MSLVNALLGSSVPMDIYVALRSDGARGSGTEADPYSGGFWNSPLYNVTAIALSNWGLGDNFYIVTLTFAAHSFAVGDMIEVAGFQGADGELLNGRFKVYSVDIPNAKLSYLVLFSGAFNQLPALSASPSITGASCRLDPYLFDAVMRSLPQNVPVTVHLGPGVFQTKGYNYYYRRLVSWRILPGMKLRGSGIGVTTLQLVGATYRHTHYFIFGSPEVDDPTDPNYPGLPNVADGFEASDMTLDLNIVGQPSQRLTLGAAVIRGSNTLLRRLRVINWGRQGSYPNAIQIEINSPECFPILIGGSSYGNTAGYYQAKNCVVEECIVEQPGLNYAAEGTMIGVLTGNTGNANTLGLFPLPTLASVIRNCVINCEYQTNPNPIVSVQWISFTVVGTSGILVAQVTTMKPHGFAVDDWARVAGVVVTGSPPAANPYDNPYNGAFQVTSVISSTQFQYASTVLTGDDPGSPDSVQRNLWVGRFSSDYVGIVDLVDLSQITGTTIYEMSFETATPHFLIKSSVLPPLAGAAPGSVVYVSGIYMSTGELSPLNGLWTVQAVTSNKTFTAYKDFQGISPTPSLTDIQTPITNVQIGTTFQGVGEATLIEGNQIRNCARGGPYIDTWGAKELVVRGNIYTGIRLGTQQDITQGSPPPLADRPRIDFVSIGGPSGKTATFKTRSALGVPHFLTVGQGILVNNVKNTLGDPNLFYNRSYKIIKIPDAYSFQIELDQIPDPVGPSPDASFEYIWEITQSIIENNVFEVLPAVNTGVATCYGVLCNGTIESRFTFGWPAQGRDFWRYRNLSIRGNSIRFAALDNGTIPIPPQNPANTAVSTVLVENGDVTNNLVVVGLNNNLTSGTIRYLSCGHLRYFNNKTPEGTLIQGAPQGVAALEPELTTLVQDALCIAFL